MSEQQLDSTSSPSSLSPAQVSALSSPWLSLASLVSSTGLSVYVIHTITKAWLQGLIPDWKYALGGIVLASLPAGVLGQVALAATRRFLPGNKP